MKSRLEFHYEGQFIFQKIMKVQKAKELKALIVLEDKIANKNAMTNIIKKFAVIFSNVKKSNFLF